MLTDEVATKYNLYDQVDIKFAIGSRDIVLFPKLIIGKYEFRNLPGIIERPNANTNDLSILGNALLKRFNVIVDNQNGYIYLKPNSLYNKPFDHPEILIQRIIIGSVILVAVIIAVSLT